MPKSEKKYPDWVQQYRTRGTTVKKRGDSYYLYKRTSRRMEGKKYPQPVDTYIGVITPDGIIPGGRMLGGTDEDLFQYVFMEWIGEIVDSRNTQLVVDGKALRAAAEKKNQPEAYDEIHDFMDGLANAAEAGAGFFWGTEFCSKSLRETTLRFVRPLLTYPSKNVTMLLFRGVCIPE